MSVFTMPRFLQETLESVLRREQEVKPCYTLHTGITTVPLKHHYTGHGGHSLLNG